MQIISEPDYDLTIDKVTLEDLQWTSNDCVAFLELVHEPAIGFACKVSLQNLNAPQQKEVEILVDGNLPTNLIPRFAIDIDCFLSQSSAELKKTVEGILSSVLTPKTSLILLLSEDGDKVEVELTIGSWITSGSIELAAVSEYLVSE